MGVFKDVSQNQQQADIELQGYDGFHFIYDRYPFLVPLPAPNLVRLVLQVTFFEIHSIIKCFLRVCHVSVTSYWGITKFCM